MKKMILAAVLAVGTAAFADAGIVIGLPGLTIAVGGREPVPVMTEVYGYERDVLPPPPPRRCWRYAPEPAFRNAPPARFEERRDHDPRRFEPRFRH